MVGAISKMFRSERMIVVLRFVLAAIFAGAGVMKLTGSIDYGGTIYGSVLEKSPWIGHSVAVVEIIFAIWLISGFRLRWAALSLVVSLSLFIGLIGAELLSSTPRACGCFGSAVSASASVRVQLMTSLLMNVGLIIAGVFLAGVTPVSEQN